MSCRIRININQATETTRWRAQGTPCNDATHCLPARPKVTGQTHGQAPPQTPVPKHPTLARSPLSPTQARHGRSNAGPPPDSEATHACSLLADRRHPTDHTPATQRAPVSPGRAADRRSSPPTAKGHCDSSPGHVYPPVTVRWRRRSGSTALWASARPAGRPQARKHRKPPHQRGLQAFSDRTKGAAKAHTQQAGMPAHSTLGHNTQPAHTQAPGQRRGVPTDPHDQHCTPYMHSVMQFIKCRKQAVCVKD